MPFVSPPPPPLPALVVVVVLTPLTLLELPAYDVVVDTIVVLEAWAIAGPSSPPNAMAQPRPAVRPAASEIRSQRIPFLQKDVVLQSKRIIASRGRPATELGHSPTDGVAEKDAGASARTAVQPCPRGNDQGAPNSSRVRLLITGSAIWLVAPSYTLTCPGTTGQSLNGRWQPKQGNER